MKEIKRIVNTGFWDDNLVLNKFSPEDKYFMLYLLTNPYTSQLGIYNFPIKKCALDMGYSEDSIRVLLDRFENKYDLIKYSSNTGEIAIKNYLRHAIIKGGKPVMDCLLKEEKQIKDKSLLGYIYCHLINYIDDASIIPTVKEYINHLKNTNYINIYINNDNDNERNVDVTYNVTSDSEDSFFDLEHAFDVLFDIYPKKNNAFSSKMAFLDEMKKVIPENRKEIATNYYFGLQMYLKKHLEDNPDDLNYKYIPKFDNWLKEDGLYWATEYEKSKKVSE